MSGIIGGAGSKSGVIGETEIDYEEGTFTATPASGTAVTGDYSKIGKRVWVNFWFSAAQNGGMTGTCVTGLPFTSDIANHPSPTYNTAYPASKWVRMYDNVTSINWQESTYTSDIGWSFSYPTI